MQLTKKNILALLEEQDGAIHFAGLLREFGGRHVRHELKRLLEVMADDGEIARFRGNSYALAAAVKSVRGTLSVHRDGYGFVAPDSGGDDIFIPQKGMRDAMHGDTVEVRAERSRMGGGKQEGRITAVTRRASSRIVGRYEETRRGGIVIPEETRLNLVVAVPPKGKGLAQDGHQVVVELTGYPVGGRPAEGRIVEVLGWPDDPEVEVQSAIRRFDLPHVFSTEALAEAERTAETVAKGELKDRVDLRTMTTVTIDGETARDFDDAVSLKREGDRFRLWVSIADVSHYVTPGSALDTEALARGTSVYFPDRCIPMLPERLSNGICSLNPSVDRLTMTAEMLFDKSGTMLESSFYPSIIRSTARLTYTLVKQIIVDSDPAAMDTHRRLTPMLMDMKELALSLQAMRRRRGSIDFDLPEPEIIIGLTGQTEGIIRAERNLAHQLIEQFMLSANEAVAAYITARAIPFLYRVHETPDPAKLVNFQELVYGFGYEFPLVAERVNPADLQLLLAQAEGKPEERMVNYALLRCMKQARYAAENLGHFGLASKCYCHFTSPIRRYPDLVVHRILRAALAAGFDSAQPTHVSAQPTHVSAQPAHVFAQPTHVSAQPTHVSAQPAHVSAQPAHVFAQPAHVSAQPAHVSAQPAHVSAQPAHVSVQPTDRSLSGAEGKRAQRELSTATSRLGEVAEHTSKRERVAMEAERDVVELKKVQYMQRHLGEEFDGFITGVTGFGFFVELDELFVEGMVHITTLDDDLYTHMENQHALVGRRLKRVFRIGDAARVRVAAVIPATRRIEFVLVGHTVSAAPARTGGGVVPHEEYPRIPLRGRRVSGRGPNGGPGGKSAGTKGTGRRRRG